MNYIETKRQLVTEMQSNLTPESPENRDFVARHRGFLLVLVLRFNRKPLVEVYSEGRRKVAVVTNVNRAKAWVHQYHERNRRVEERKVDKVLSNLGIAEGLQMMMSKRILA